MGDKTGIEWTRGDDGTPGAAWNPATGLVCADDDACLARGYKDAAKAGS